MGVRKKTLLLIGDACMLYGALALALVVRYWDISSFPEQWTKHLLPFSVIFPFWLLIFYWNDLYRFKALRDRRLLLKSLFRAILLAVLGSVLLFYLFPGFFGVNPKTNLFVLGISSFFVLYIWRARILSLFVSRATNIILLGNSNKTQELCAFLESNPHAGFRVADTITSEKDYSLERIKNDIEKTNARLIVVEKHFANNMEFVRSLYKLIPLEVSIMQFSDFYEVIFEKEPLEELGEDWFVQNISARRPMYDSTKRIVDIVCSLCFGIIMIAPWIIIAILVKLSSRGPVIYKQTRIGKNGELFTIYKFRTMHVDSEKNGPQWSSVEHDPRVTALGKVLRHTHLDETPQFWNILKGDCSFVGPRPERPEFVSVLQKDIPFYEMRHIVRPGLAGWAQTNYKYGSSIEDAKEKLAYDIYYIRSRSLMTDLFIVIRTIKHIFVKLI
ncbi:exopolysaccharide biosynthesis polyprenyl glycosylphosphotransferase [Candidatus Parcubacteria bacterium]|jgi:exopolysaccharide biosynthesis polyprenyl glycosylphosphotransferase|nr:MAG: exopolysaccharide biosynthesis polyprenyl glycosylphosphotransferase [Candidatus Parcubacteria bacterium]